MKYNHQNQPPCLASCGLINIAVLLMGSYFTGLLPPRHIRNAPSSVGASVSGNLFSSPFEYKTLSPIQKSSRRDGGGGAGVGCSRTVRKKKKSTHPPILGPNCFPLISLICHLKKKAPRAATQTLLSVLGA